MMRLRRAGRFFRSARQRSGSLPFFPPTSLGNDDSFVLAENRETYLVVAYLGNPPEGLDAEEEPEIQSAISGAAVPASARLLGPENSRAFA